jgi:DNA-binding transcriptional LysR family regulator
VTWAPLSLVGDDLRAGRLVQLGGPGDAVRIEVHLLRPRVRQSRTAERFWERLLDHLAGPVAAAG